MVRIFRPEEGIKEDGENYTRKIIKCNMHFSSDYVKMIE
jgi:hypothetical protein